MLSDPMNAGQKRKAPGLSEGLIGNVTPVSLEFEASRELHFSASPRCGGGDGTERSW
jgi:hypothetical protein